jgi:patatin-like phospholipase/acyl hydrolase
MPGKDLRLLALDGGGVRGLSALMILQQLMVTIDPEHPPKPCDYFDIIGGTSTGGQVIASATSKNGYVDRYQSGLLPSCSAG